MGANMQHQICNIQHPEEITTLLLDVAFCRHKRVISGPVNII